jgi:hypothetical protein
VTGLSGGTLIYAADEGISAAEHIVLDAGKKLQVVALDLSAPSNMILRQIDRLATGIRKSPTIDTIKPASIGIGLP